MYSRYIGRVFFDIGLVTLFRIANLRPYNFCISCLSDLNTILHNTRINIDVTFTLTMPRSSFCFQIQVNIIL